MGRLTQRWQENPVNSNNIEIFYTYDLIGDEITRNINSEGFSETYNGAGRLTSFTQTDYTDANNPANLLSGATYDALGRMVFANFGNGLSQSWKYDNRERPAAEAVGTGCTSGAGTCTTTKYNTSLTYFANGNVMSANDAANGNWVYTYDDFNRLLSSTGGPNNYSYAYAYDRFGNKWQQTLNGGCTAGTAFCIAFDANNRMTNGTQTYDAAGNVLSDSAHTYSYDAENRLVSVDHGATTYGYDADGQRVFKTTAGALTDFIYDRDGHIILISPATPTMVELYAGGMHLATKVLNSGGTDTDTYFDHADWLGTERARTNMSGNACDMVASLPFGDGQTDSSTCAEAEVSPMHFTGKQRDPESNLDNFGARYYASNMGRFMSPDWAARPTAVPYAAFGDPQSLDLYVYVREDPVTLADLDGHDTIDAPATNQPPNNPEDTTINSGVSYGVAVVPDMSQLISEALQNAAALSFPPCWCGAQQQNNTQPQNSSSWTGTFVKTFLKELNPFNTNSTFSEQAIAIGQSLHGMATGNTKEIIDAAPHTALGLTENSPTAHHAVEGALIGATVAAGTAGALIISGNDIQIRGGIHGPHHNFPGKGLRPHAQINWWKKGVKGSGGAWRWPF